MTNTTVEGVIRDRRISPKLKQRNMLSSSVTWMHRYDGTNRETTGEGAGSRKQPGKKNRVS